MAGIGDVGILFKIKADSDQAEREFKKFKKELDDIDERGKDPLQRLASQAGLTAAQFSGLQTAVLGATAIIGTISVAAVAAAAAIFRLTVDASEYGSAILEASQKTGLSTEAISALKIAADQSGSSLEAVTAGIARFAKNYTGTSQDLQTELGKVFQQIADAKPGFEQLQLAQEKFGRSGANLIPIIQSFKGNLPDLIDQMKRLGLTMTQDAAEKADQFGDQLDTLKAQSAALGRQFATELMPLMTQAMAQISASMAANQGQAQKWGQVLVNAAKGVGVVYKAFEISVLASLNAVTLGFSSTSNVVVAKSAIMTTAIYALLGPLGMLAALGQMLGGATGGVSSGVDSTVNSILDQMQAAGGLNIPKVSGGGRGGGGGGGGSDPAADAEKRRREAVEAAQKIVDDTLAIYKVGYEEREAALEAFLQRGEILEIEKIRDVARIRLEALMDEKRLTEGLLSNSNITLNEKERAEILQKIKILTIQIRVEKLKGGTEINAQVKKEIADAEKQLEIERERLETERKRRNERNKAASNSLLDKEKAEIDRLAAEKKNSQRLGGGGTQWEELFKFLQGNNQFKDNSALIAGIEVMRSAFEGLAQAIGQVVQAWVLYGSAGASVRQVTAQILASIAQQAAVKAIFELAEGFAALARAFFGDPKAGAEAAMHFKSAATYGIVAGVAAVAGRGVAGNSFNQTAGSAGSGGVGAGNGASQQNNFTTRFNGFGNAMGEQIQRQTQVLAALEETNNRLAKRIDGMSPEQVVVLGANGASRAIVGALHSEYSDNPASVDGTMRNLGFAR